MRYQTAPCPACVSKAGILFGRERACREPRLEQPGKLVRESASPRTQGTPVTAKILDGKAVAQQIRDELGPRVARIRERLGRPPALSIVLVGDDPASQVYVRNKLKTAEEAGMGIAHERLGRNGDVGRNARGGSALQRRPGGRRDPRAVAAAESDGCGRGAASVRRDRPEQGRRRLQPDFRGPSGAEPRRVSRRAPPRE